MLEIGRKPEGLVVNRDLSSKLSEKDNFSRIPDSDNVYDRALDFFKKYIVRFLD